MTPQAYVRALRDLYIRLPQTSRRCSRSDSHLASDLYQRQVPFETVRSALLLTIVNRLYREGPTSTHHSLILLLRSSH